MLRQPLDGEGVIGRIEQPGPIPPREPKRDVVTLHVTLTEADFVALLKGQTVRKGLTVRAEIILADIGLDRMVAAIIEAQIGCPDPECPVHHQGPAPYCLFDPLAGTTEKR